jgi:hypothetical protein
MTPKMSDIMKEMSEVLLRNPKDIPSSEARHVALFFANAAWNESLGLGSDRGRYRSVWETIEAEKPDLWSELKSNEVDSMIDALVHYKKSHYPDDSRRILTCGTVEGNVRVEWLPAAAPGVDSTWEMQLFGLVRTGARQKAIRFVQDSRRLSRNQATKLVADTAAKLGIR